MQDEKRRKMDELDRLSREQDRRYAEQEIDRHLAPAADVIAAEIVGLAGMLAELDLIGEDNRGTPRWQVDLGAREVVNGIEVEHPEPRLYTRDKDSIIASRMRPDGRYEHALLDEHGLPIEWRTAYRPDLN